MAGRHPFPQHEADLLVGDVRGAAAQREQLQQNVSGCVQQPFEGGRDPGHNAHDAGERGGNALGMAQRDPLRQQLAENQREVGKADHHYCHADRMRITREDAAGLGKTVLQVLAERRLAKGAN